MSSKEEVVVGIKARSVLWYLTFIGFAMNYMIRININIAIVDMISDEFKSNNRKVHLSECQSESSNNSTLLEMINPLTDKQIVTKKHYFSVERQILDHFEVSDIQLEKPESQLMTLCRSNTSPTASHGTPSDRTRCRALFSSFTGQHNCQAAFLPHVMAQS